MSQYENIVSGVEWCVNFYLSKPSASNRLGTSPNTRERTDSIVIESRASARHWSYSCQTMLSHSFKATPGFSFQRIFVCQACIRQARNQQKLTAIKPSSLFQRRLLQTSTTPEDIVPFRKQLKDEAKRKWLEGNSKVSKTSSKGRDPRLEKWELTVGIEIHAELNTARKLFSSATTSSGDAPNTHAALFDVAFPGAQPHFQRETLIPALRAAIALHCEIQPKSSFDRKHYFYQDQPAGYQITQYYGTTLAILAAPIC